MTFQHNTIKNAFPLEEKKIKIQFKNFLNTSAATLLPQKLPKRI
jgi:hypothetical protein